MEQIWSPEVELLSYIIRQRKLIMIWLVAVICHVLDRVSLKDILINKEAKIWFNPIISAINSSIKN